LLAIAVTFVTIAAAGVAQGGPPSTAVSTSGTAPNHEARATTGVLHASEVLQAWDHLRGVAWSRADAPALADLYTPASRTGRRDVRDLRRWRGRGLRVVGLRQQVSGLRVRAETSRRLVLVITDRTVGGVAVGHRRRTALPASAWAQHRIVLRRVGDRWLVEDVVTQPAR
jgi:hypothetical protein